MKPACLLLLLFVMPLAQAQHTLSVPIVLERAVSTNLPEWTLTFVSVRKTAEENNSNFRWTRERQDVAIALSENASAEQARITQTSLLTAAPRHQTKLENLGDEAYLISPSPYGPPRFDVVFRKGRVRVSIEAPSPDVGRRFAEYIAAALPAS